MTVAELIAELGKIPGHYEVVLPPSPGCEFCAGDELNDRVGSVTVAPNYVDGHGLAAQVGW